MQKLKAFSLIEISVCLIIMGVLMSMVLSTSNIIQKRIYYQKVSEALKNAEANLAGYVYKYKKFPAPEGRVVHEYGAVKGDFPSKEFGPTSVKIEYYVDERILIESEDLSRIRKCSDNKMNDVIPSHLAIAFVLKHKDQMTYMTCSGFLMRYFSHVKENPVFTHVPGAPVFQK
ncbi:MAG: type II secretion system protein [Alphaproteobacteria bacterium]|nr:MAG: type II secretion system protein [Alphaproteobacteria bacterium]